MTDVLERLREGTPTPGAGDTATAPPAPRLFRPDIEGLRALAVIAVVLHEAGIGPSGGFVGVDVFFVITGFLVTRALLGAAGLGAGLAIREFLGLLAARLRRVVPGTAAVTIAAAVATALLAGPAQAHAAALDALAAAFFGLNVRYGSDATHYLRADATASPLYHLWPVSLGAQVLLGLGVVVTSVIVLTAPPALNRLRRPVLVLLFSSAAITSYCWSITATAHLSPWGFFSPLSRIWEFALGALVGTLALPLARLPRALAELAGLLGLGLIAGAALLLTETHGYPAELIAAPVAGTALVLAAGTGAARRVERLLGESFLQCLGRISFSWYLWAWPLLVIVALAAAHPLSWQLRVVVVWVSIVIAVGSYFLLEDAPRRLVPTNLPWLSISALATAVVACSALVVIAAPAGPPAVPALARPVAANQSPDAVLATMRQAVASGVAAKAAPTGLPLSAAAADRPVADSTACHADLVTIKQPACVYGDAAGAHTVVLLGDTHADMWLPAFDAAAKSAHWQVVDWTKAACPAADIATFSPTLNRSYTECATWRVDVLSRIAALKPDLVVMSDSENVVGASVSAQQWSSSTLATMNAVHASSGAKVVLMQDVPVPGRAVPPCLTAHQDDVSACTFAMAKAYSFPTRHRQLATDVAQAGFTVLEPAAWICTANRCPAVVNGMVVYRDDSNLTATFSAWLAPYVAPLLRIGS